MMSYMVSPEDDEVEISSDRLPEIFDDIDIPDSSIFNEALAFYKKIVLKEPDLIICMSRKSWCVIQLFLPYLEKENIFVKSELTHDRMVHPWFAEQDPDKRDKIKVIVVDDTFQTGRALDKCVQRLKCVYNVDKNNITLAVFAMSNDERNLKRINKDKDLYTVYPACSGKEIFQVNWLSGNFYPKETILKISYFFVKALHACSIPYVGYIPAFSLPLKDVQKFLGAKRGKKIKFGSKPVIRIPGYLEQDDLKAPLNDPSIMGYFNITSQQMRQDDVEAFFILLPALDSRDKHYLPFLPPKHAFSIAALRFYLNRNTNVALVVPYLSLKDCYAEKDIAREFPEELRPLMREMCSTDVWEEYEGRLAAYRLLRFASCYLWGKYVFKQWFGREVKEEDIVSHGGICSKKFFTWLNGPYVEKDLMSIWSFFDPQRKNIVEDPPEQTKLEDLIRDEMSADEEKYKEAIDDKSFASLPVSYFDAASMMFRRLYEKDRELQNQGEKSTLDKNSAFIIKPFLGFPLNVFFASLLEKYPELKERKDVLVSVTLMLCDMGIAVTQLCQRESKRNGKIIGTVLFNGEQSCHSLAPIAPEYAYFLSNLPKILKKFNKDERQEKFNTAKVKIRNYFEEEKTQGVIRRLSIDELMAPLDHVENILVNAPGRKVEAYTFLPRSLFYDSSEPFFTKLSEELTT